MDPKYYENDYFLSATEELDFVKSPFYDLARMERMSKEEAHSLFESLEHKMNSMESLT